MQPCRVGGGRDLWGFLNERTVRLSWGSGHGPGVSVYLLIDGIEQPLFGIYGYTDGLSTLAINFEYLATRAVSRQRLDQIADHVRAIPGATERLRGLEEAGFRKRPGLPIDTVVASPGAVECLKALVDALETPP